MGYVHNTHMVAAVPLKDIVTTVGTFTMAEASHLWTLNKTAADDTSVLQIPLAVPQNSEDHAGSIINSVDLYYEVGTAALEAMSQKTYLVTYAEEGESPTVTEKSSDGTFVLTVEEHKLSCLINVEYPQDNQQLFMELTINAAATSVFKLRAVNINYTLRV